MQHIKWLLIIATLSSAHTISSMDFNNLSILDYAVIITSIAVYVCAGLYFWREKNG